MFGQAVSIYVLVNTSGVHCSVHEYPLDGSAARHQASWIVSLPHQLLYQEVWLPKVRRGVATKCLLSAQFTAVYTGYKW